MTKRVLVVPFLLAFAAAGFAQNPTSAKGDAYYHFSKGRLLDDQGHASQAIDEYKKALELDPNNSMIYSEMAESFLKNNRVREAVDTAKDRKSTRLNSSHLGISYAVFCLYKKIRLIS